MSELRPFFFTQRRINAQTNTTLVIKTLNQGFGPYLLSHKGKQGLFAIYTKNVFLQQLTLAHRCLTKGSKPCLSTAGGSGAMSGLVVGFFRVQVLIVLSCASLVCSSNVFANHWLRAVRQTMFEQEVEDCNAVHKVDNHLARRLIVMPLTDSFNPHSSNVMFGKVQFGDKCSLPASIGRLVFEGNDGKPYEVPWLFEIKPVNSRRKKSFAVADASPKAEASSGAEAQPQTLMPDSSEAQTATEMENKPTPDPTPVQRILDKAYISPLDFRSPENYIFLPRWLMKTLGLRINDLVDVSFVRIKLAGLVVFQPLTLAWDSLIGSADGATPVSDPKTILEHEVNKYSSLTAGSVIEIEHNGVIYPLYVKETRAESGVRMLGVRVQDSDVKVDIDRKVVDALFKRKQEEDEARGEGGVEEDEGGASEGVGEGEEGVEVVNAERVSAAAVGDNEEGDIDDNEDEEEDEEEEEDDAEAEDED